MKFKLFYGWYIVIAGMVLATYYSAIFGYGWQAFVNPIATTFGWTMATLSLASSMRSLEMGVFNPVWGGVVDRWSPRWLMRIGVITTALGTLLLSLTKNLPMYYGGFLIMGLGSSLVTNMLPTALIARWFKKDVGKANGLFFMGQGIGGVTVPLVVALVDNLTWQTTLLYVSISFFIMGIAVSFVMRNRPEDYGLVPDGRTPTTPGGGGRSRTSDFGLSVKEALKTRAFWFVGFVTLFQVAIVGAINLYGVPYLTNVGMTRATAGSVVSLFTLISLFTRIPMGLLSDIFRKTHVIALTVLLQGGGIFLFWLIGGSSPFWLIFIFALTYGIGVSGVAALRAPFVADYFGTKNFGTIFGLISIFTTVGQIASPPIAGWVFDTYHTYKPVWLVLGLFTIVALIVILSVPPSGRKIETAAGQPKPA